MKTAEVRLKTGEYLHGTIADVDYSTKTFYLLGQDQIGMIGRRQGTPIRFEECDYVYFRNRDGGPFEPPNYLTIWQRVNRYPARAED